MVVVRGDKLRAWGEHTQTTVYKTDNQQGPTIQHRELYSIVCNDLDGKRIWTRIYTHTHIYGRPSGEEHPCQCRRCRFDPRIGTLPQSRKWQPTPAFLPGESHGQRSLGSYRPWVTKSQTRLSNLTTTCVCVCVHTHIKWENQPSHCFQRSVCILASSFL